MKEAFVRTHNEDHAAFTQVDNGFKALTAALENLPADPAQAVVVIKEKAGTLAGSWKNYAENTRPTAWKAMSDFVNTKINYLQTELAFKDSCGYI